MAPAHFGIDKAEAPEPTWLRALYDASSLRITGAYIDGPALTGHTAPEFTSPSQATNRRWMDRVPEVTRDGWGIVLFYLGYSSRADGSAHQSVWPPSGQPTRERGRLHAQHVKRIVATSIPGWAGAVVMIDNENSEAFDLDAPAEQPLRDYYLALCEELTRPGPDGAPPMRPGFYLHAPVGRPLLRERPDLFIWDVQIDVADAATSTTTRAPFDPAAPRIEVAPVLAIRSVSMPSGGPGRGTRPAPWFAWPTGRQFRFYTGSMPQPRSPVTRAVPALTPISRFDFDCALVRDAAFPVAEPRLAAFSGRADPTVLQGSFADPVRQGPEAHPASMGLALLASHLRGPDPQTDPSQPIEPDAPLTAVPPQLPDTVFSILRGGQAVERSLTAGAWSAWTQVGGSPFALRRLRALAAIKHADGTRYLLTVSAEHRLHAQRRLPGGAWSDPAPMAGDLRLHPFSSLAAALRGDQVEVLCLNANGALVNAWWSPLIAGWPGEAHADIESEPALLAGGSLAAIAPDPQSLLVFGIGRDLRLNMAIFRASRGWRAPQPLGQPEHRLTPHARISAHVVSPTLVEVAGISHDLQLMVHRLRVTAGEWTADTPTALPAIPAAEATDTVPRASSRALVEPAAGCTPNPFGDVVLGRTATPRSYVAVTAVAATAPRTATVARFLDGQEEWWRYR